MSMIHPPTTAEITACLRLEDVAEEYNKPYTWLCTRYSQIKEKNPDMDCHDVIDEIEAALFMNWRTES